MSDKEKIAIGVPDVMKLLGLGRVRVENIMHGSHFPTITIGRRVLVHREVLEKWLKTGKDIQF